MLFHVSHGNFAIGDVINPGGWGVIARSFSASNVPAANDAIILLWEMALETARLATCPDRPSRLDCVFAVANMKEAKAFRDKYRQGAHIYRVEPTHDDYRSYRGDFWLISRDRIGVRPFIEYMSSEAVQYWTAEASDEPEILISCSVRVLERVE